MPAAAACSQLLHYCEIVPPWQSPCAQEVVGPPVQQSSRFGCRAKITNGISMFCFKSQRQDLCGKKCCWEGVKQRQNQEFRVLFKDGDSSGSCHGSLPENCTALSLLRSEATESY